MHLRETTNPSMLVVTIREGEEHGICSAALKELLNVYAHMYLFMTFHNGFMFLLHLFFFIYKHVIMNRHGHHIRNGIVWVQTGHWHMHIYSHMVCLIEL